MIPLSVIENIPGVGGIVSFIKDKGRLALEYALIGLVIAMSAYCLSVYIKGKNTERALEKTVTALKSANSQLALQEAITEDQRAAILDLKSTRESDANAFNGLLKDFRVLSLKDAAAKKKLESLERQNEKARDYLNNAVPPELECLLLNACEDSSKDNN